MKRANWLIVGVITVAVVAVFVEAQPITGGGLTRVFHGSAFTGTGQLTSPMNLTGSSSNVCSGGSAAASATLDSNGHLSVTCVAAGLTGSCTANHLCKGSAGSAIATGNPVDDGVTISATEPLGDSAGTGTSSSTADLIAVIKGVLTSGVYADPPYNGTHVPIFSGVLGQVSGAPTCSGGSCGETSPMTCGVRGVESTPFTAWNTISGAAGTGYGACVDSEIVAKSIAVGVSVITPDVTTASGSLTLVPAANQNVVIGDPGGTTDVGDDTWIGGVSPNGNAGAHKLNVVGVASSGVPTALASSATVDACFVHGASSTGLTVARATADAGAAKLTLYKTRATDAATATAVQSNDTLGSIQFEGVSTTTIVNPAGIQAIVESGAVGAGSIPTDLVLFAGSTGVAEFMRGYPDQHARFIGPVDLNSSLINNVADPVSNQDADTKLARVTAINAAVNGTTGKLMTYASAHASTDYAGSTATVCPAGTAVTQATLSNSGTLTTTCTATGALAPGAVASISISHSSSALGTVNLSTLGTVDWYECGNSGYSTFNVLASNTPTQTAHAKFSPSGPSTIFSTFETLCQGASTLVTSGGTVTFQSTASDDQTSVALNSATNQFCYCFTASAATGYGFRFQVPAVTSQRVLRTYSNAASCLITTTATLTVSGTVATDTFDTTTTQNELTTITFTGGVPGDQLTVTQVCTTGHGGTTQLGFAAASLGPT